MLLIGKKNYPTIISALNKILPNKNLKFIPKIPLKKIKSKCKLRSHSSKISKNYEANQGYENCIF